MAVVSQCPDASILQQLALGKMSPADVEKLARHCEQCSRCIGVLHTLQVRDPLIDAMTARRPAADPSRDDAVNALIERLQGMPPPAPQPGDSISTLAGGAAPSSETAGGRPARNAPAPDFALSPPQAPDEIGRLGGYRVLKMLGAGGMGMVYQAEDVHLQRRIALKVMKAELARDAGNRERFLREARAAAKLKSDHVVTIHQVGEERQIVYLAMEFLEGLSLADWLHKGRKPTPAQAARIGRQIALGLADAHACGLIHRDIKPGNIWLDSRHQGRVKLLDFGLARGRTENVQLTQTGAIVGTPAYMAPEQARGGKVDHRCDLFSLGVVLYRLTTGQMPFRGDNPTAILVALALDKPTPPSEINPQIPPRMSVLIESLLAKDPAQRPATAKAVAGELAAIEREARQPAASNTMWDFSDTTERKRPARDADATSLAAPSRSRIVWIAAASLLLLLGGVAATIVIIVRDKKGNEISRTSVPEGGSVEIKDDGKGKAQTKSPPPIEKVKKAVQIEAEPLPPLRPGQPLSPIALVANPPKLPGLRSWSIVQREGYSVSAGAYRPDGKRLAVSHWDGNVHIWEIATGRLVQALVGEAAVSTLAWSPDGRVLALGTGLNPQAVRLWDADSGRRVRNLQSPVNEFAKALAWSADGRKVRAWGHANRLWTWEAAQGKLLHSTPIACQWPAFSADGQRFAGIVDGKRVVVWDADSGKEESRIDAPAAVWRLGWSPDGKLLACTGADGIRVWDAASRKETFHYPKPVGELGVPAWSPNGRRLSFITEAHTGVTTINLTADAAPRRLANNGGALSLWSPDGTTIALVDGSPFVRLFDAASGKKLRSLNEGKPIDGVAWSPDRQRLAVLERYTPYLASTDTGQVLAELKDAAWPAEWSADGKHLAAAGTNNALQVWQAGGKLQFNLAGHKAQVMSLAWSPDGKRLASTAAAEKRVLIWDAIKGEKARELGPFGGVAEKVKWSADGRLLSFNVPEIGWHVWDVEKDRLINDPRQWKVFWLDLAPDGRSALVTPTETETYRLRDLASGKETAALTFGHSIYLAYPVWTADGRMLAFAHYGGIELWRSDLRERVRQLPSGYGMGQLTLSGDGKLIAGSTGDRLIFWETGSGRLRGTLLLGRRNNGLALTPEGYYTGNVQVERGIVVVVQKEDGTQELMEPAEFERKYGWKNDPARVRLLSE
jgi:serine/threonine protein kinase/WD40 repeat protein